jgi:hypothetical protein
LSALAFIKQAADCGVRASPNGDSLALKAATKPSASFLAKLKQHKAEIVALLRQHAAALPQANAGYRMMTDGKPSTPLAGFWTHGGLAVEFQWVLGELFDVPRHWRKMRAHLVSTRRDGSRARTRSCDYGKREEFLERKGFRRWAIAGRDHR